MPWQSLLEVSDRVGKYKSIFGMCELFDKSKHLRRMYYTAAGAVYLFGVAALITAIGSL